MKNHPTAPTRRRALGLVLAVAGLGLFAVEAANGQSGTAESPLSPSELVVRPIARPVVVHWEARALAPGARFRLLRGAPGGAFELIAELPAEDGLQTYRVRDDASAFVEQVYELRVVSHDGVEQVLRRVHCAREPVCSPGVPTAGAGRPTTIGLTLLPSLFDLPSRDAGAFALPPSAVGSFRHAPPVPPPREVAFSSL